MPAPAPLRKPRKAPPPARRPPLDRPSTPLSGSPDDTDGGPTHQLKEVKNGGAWILTTCGIEGHRIHTNGQGPQIKVTPWGSWVTCEDCLPNLVPDPIRPGPMKAHPNPCEV